MPTDTTASGSDRQTERLSRFRKLESDIRHFKEHATRTHDNAQVAWLNEYIDLGLDMADQARSSNHVRLQESWLRRVYTTLFETALDLVQPEYWRNLCMDYLYQPLFALEHLYRAQPQGSKRIRALYYELSVTTRYMY